MTVKTDLYDEAVVVSKSRHQYEIEIRDGNDIAREWIDQVKCEEVKGD